METLEELLKKHSLTRDQLERILAARGKVEIKPLALSLNAGKEYTFGAVSDTHLGSSEEKLRELHTFYRLLKERGITDVYHSGDLVAGNGRVYPGQEFELKVFGADNQVAHVIECYPKVEGIKTHFILGNHCYSFYQQSGADIGLQVAEKRPDMDYLGPFTADVMMDGIRLIRLVHLKSANAYALSYRLQKYVEQIPSGLKPRILLSGHPHTIAYFPYRNIHCFACGSFEGQTTLLARLGINPIIGGWIIKLTFGKDKKRSIVSIVPEFIPFYS